MSAPRPPDFSDLVREHQRSLRGFLRRICWSFEEADDLAQETFITAWQQLHRFRGEASFRSWLCGIAYRKALASGRSQLRRTARETEAAEAEPAAYPISAESRLDLRRALSSLSAAQQAAVALCWASGFSHEEAAATLQLPLGTLKSHLIRARERLRTELESENGTA